MNDEELSEMTHLLERWEVILGHEKQLVEQLRGSHVILEQERLVTQCVQDVVFGKTPTLALIDLEALSISTGGMSLLSAFGETISGEDDVEGVLANGRRRG